MIDTANGNGNAHVFRVPFRDVDMHGHVHNGVFLSYFETAINEFLRRADLLRHFSPDSPSHRYHVRKTELVYNKPVHFDDRIAVATGIARIGTSSLTFSGEIRRGDEAGACVNATVVWVCVDTATQQPTAIPEATRSALAPLCADRPATASV